MRKPLIIAYHLTWTAYGFWLPNDPRGSTSHYIASDPIAELGAIHFGRKQIQPAGWLLRDFRERAKDVLKYPVSRFDSADVDTIAREFADVIRDQLYTCYACAIMPDHIHILIRKHKKQAEDMIEDFQNISRLRLRTAERRSDDHPVWGGRGWQIFLEHPDDIRRTIRYIEQNPVKWRLPPQPWDFVTAYDDWPLHPGHNPNSPYARGLRTAGRIS